MSDSCPPGKIQFYRSPDFDALADAWMSNFQRRLSGRDPLKTETVIVHSHAMARYLNQTLTRRLGVTAMIRYLLPNAFENRVREALLSPHQDWEHIRSRENPFDPPYLRWFLYYLLIFPGHGDNIKNLSVMAGLWEDNELSLPIRISKIKAFELSRTMAELFNAYLYFREEMLWEWDNDHQESPPEIQWQKWLWQTLRQHIPFPHRLEELSQIKDILKNKKIDQGDKFGNNLSGQNHRLDILPDRISIFGISFLPNYYLELFHSLGRVIDIDYYYPDTTRPFFLEGSTPRLPSFFERLTELSQTYQLSIEKLDWQVHELPQLSQTSQTESATWGILRHIKSFFTSPITIPLLSEGNSDSCYPDFLIHDCQNRRREVEVVKSQILSLLEMETGKALTLDRILILAPNILDYQDYLESVFTTNPTLPYHIIDHNQNHDNAVIKAVLKVLDLFLSNWELSLIRQMIGWDLVKAGWGWSGADVQFLEEWLLRLGVKWGRGYSESFHPDLSKFSWREGIRRIMYHFALPASGEIITSLGINIKEKLDGEGGRLLGKMAYLLQKLLEYDRSYNDSVDFLVWLKRIRQLTYDLLYVKDREYLYDFKQQKDHLRFAEQFQQLEDRYRFMLETLPRSEFKASESVKTEIDLRTFREILRLELNDAEHVSTGTHGGIICGSLLPLRIIPSEVTFLIGMGREEFPRRDHHYYFNLILQSPRPGDRTQKKGDQQLFIETLYATRYHLGITYSPSPEVLEIGGETSPSLVVEELLSLLSLKSGITELRDKILIKHPALPLSDGTLMTAANENNLWLNRESYDIEDYRMSLARLNPDFSSGSSVHPCSLDKLTDNLAAVNYILRFFSDLQTKPVDDYPLKCAEIWEGICRQAGADELKKEVLDNNHISTDDSLNQAVIKLEDIKRMFIDAPGFYCRKVLGIDLKIETEKEDNEPLNLQGLDLYEILSEKIQAPLSEFLFQADINRLGKNFFPLSAIHQDPRFPGGVPGKNQLELFSKQINGVKENLKKVFEVINSQAKGSTIRLADEVIVNELVQYPKIGDGDDMFFKFPEFPRNLVVSGSIFEVLTGEVINKLSRRYLKITSSDLIKNWLDHLILHLHYRKPIFTWVIGEEDIFLYAPLQIEAEERSSGDSISNQLLKNLRTLLICYFTGRAAPVPLYRELTDGFHESQVKRVTVLNKASLHSLLSQAAKFSGSNGENGDSSEEKKLDWINTFFNIDPDRSPYAHHLFRGRGLRESVEDEFAENCYEFFYTLWRPLYRSLYQINWEKK